MLGQFFTVIKLNEEQSEILLTDIGM